MSFLDGSTKSISSLLPSETPHLAGLIECLGLRAHVVLVLVWGVDGFVQKGSVQGVLRNPTSMHAARSSQEDRAGSNKIKMTKSNPKSCKHRHMFKTLNH